VRPFGHIVSVREFHQSLLNADVIIRASKSLGSLTSSEK
jgi:hypothetical protein